MRDKVELQIDQPVDVAFVYVEGKECARRWPGAESCYARTTTDGRILFVDEDEERRLRERVRASEPVRITKRKTKEGACWLQIDSVPASLPGAPPAKASGPVAISAELRRVLAEGDTPEPTLLSRCLCDAVDAVQAAQKYAVSRGLPVAFGAGEIERIGISLFIQRTRDQGSAVMTRQGSYKH